MPPAPPVEGFADFLSRGAIDFDFLRFFRERERERARERELMRERERERARIDEIFCEKLGLTRLTQ